jgi:soluble lytic murein transglycosylase-like protein
MMTARQNRRRFFECLIGAACCLLCASHRAVRAGAQREEDLIDSVRTALTAAVAELAPPNPTDFPDTEARMAHLRWRAASSARLKPYMADTHTRDEFLQTLWYEASRAGLEPALVLGLIEVESGFRKYAISSAGARGYMQVMPFWARTIGDGEPARLFHLQTNLRFGCVILRHYLNLERGDMFMALGRYNGSRGLSPYPQAVLAARQRWLV